MASLDRLREFADSEHITMRFDEPMAGHTSLRIGGPADLALFPDEESLAVLVPFLLDQEIPYVVIGKGTNVLVSDEGIRGAAVFTSGFADVEISFRGSSLSVADRTEEVMLVAHSGCALQRVMGLSLEHGLSGIEGLVGIPGSVGGAVAGNAGSFGCEMKDVIRSVRLLLYDGTMKTVEGRELEFGYRTARLPRDSIIVAATLVLAKDDPRDVRKRVRGFMREKKSRQPVNERSAGCVFKNPAGVAAGRLIDDAGCKGMKVGGIAVSVLHANFFVNRGGGTSQEFLRLMEAVTEQVRKRFGIELEPEIHIVGRVT
ncbi:MAG: UDP-N-acetylmuramate dehydrogenase [Chloroflexota bacterium]